MSCQCKTKAEKQCKLPAQAGKLYCHIHKLCTNPIIATTTATSSHIAPSKLPFSLVYVPNKSALTNQIDAVKTQLSQQSEEVNALVEKKSGPGYGLLHYVGNCYEGIGNILGNPKKTYTDYNEVGPHSNCELEVVHPTFDIQFYHKIISDLDELFKQVTPLSDDLIVYRGSLNQPDAHRFISTSVDPFTADEYAGHDCCLMIIKVRKGSRVLPIYESYDALESLYYELYSDVDVVGLPDSIESENEVLLSRNGHWQLVNEQLTSSDLFAKSIGVESRKLYFYEYWN